MVWGGGCFVHRAPERRPQNASSKGKKARLAKLHEKKLKGKQGPSWEEYAAEMHPHERNYANQKEVGFGEVAMQPPSRAPSTSFPALNPHNMKPSSFVLKLIHSSCCGGS